MQMKRLLFCLSILTVLNFAAALAGGPILVNSNGSGPFRWDPTQPVHYKVDRGGLNASLSEQAAVDFVASILKTWHDVPSVNISFQYDGLLDIDVTKSNVTAFFKSLPNNVTPVILDKDGGITELLLGAGSSRNVLGLTSQTILDPKTNTIVQGFALINGTFDLSFLRPTMLHEFGHLSGLDHTQSGIEFTGLQPGNSVPGARRFIPIMYPIIFSGAPTDPQDDDILALSNLYPVSLSGTGTISGFVKPATGHPFPVANLVLRAADYSPAGGQVHIYSTLSDYFLRKNGEFKFQGVKPGDYYLFIEPLFDQFTGGSGFSDDEKGDLPFENRFTDFPRDFFNGSGESGDPDLDNPDDKVVIT